MKRNPDLVRELLLSLERKQSSSAISSEDFPVPAGYKLDDVRNHLVLMSQAGFVVHEAMRSSTSPDRIIDVFVFDLTWQGHEYLDTVRDPDVWRQTKAGLNKIGGASFELVVDFAKSIARQKLAQLGDW